MYFENDNLLMWLYDEKCVKNVTVTLKWAYAYFADDKFIVSALCAGS